MAAIRPVRIVAVTLLATIATAVAACGGSDELTIYSGRIEALIGPAIKLYEKDSGEKVKTRYGDSPSLAATLVEEGKNSRADLFYAQDAGSLDAIEKAGNLEQLPADLLERRSRRASARATGAGSASPRARASSPTPRRGSRPPSCPTRRSSSPTRSGRAASAGRRRTRRCRATSRRCGSSRARTSRASG